MLDLRVRLDHVSLREKQRLTMETDEERAVRLENVLLLEKQRLTMETDEERAVRLDNILLLEKQRRSMEETQIYWDGHVPSLEQETTRARMRKFHPEIATIETPTCSTCMERFPGMRVNVIKSECLRCAK